MKVKFWQGWLKSESMKEPEWIDEWINLAIKTEQKNCTPVVFKIPNNKIGIADNDTIEEIEALLQQKYPEKNSL